MNRVTDNAIHEQALHNIARARQKQLEHQEMSTSLKRINRPADDPIGLTHVMRIKNAERNVNQFRDNAAMATNILNSGDRSLEGATEIIIRAFELAVHQSSKASATPESRKSIATEIQQLKNQLVNIGNTRFGDRYIFAGYQTLKSPFNEMGMYTGDAGAINLEVRENYYVPINIPGDVVFTGAGRPPNEAVNIFNLFDRFIMGLNTDNTLMIQGTLEDWEKAQSQLFMARATLGARVNSIERTIQALDYEEVDQAKLRSEIEDTDLLKTMSDLQRDEDVLKQTMATSQRLLNVSLFDFLK